MDEKFEEYFRKRYLWTEDTPIESYPWYHQDLATWEACKEAYGLGVADEAMEIPADVYDNLKPYDSFKPGAVTLDTCVHPTYYQWNSLQDKHY